MQEEQGGKQEPRPGPILPAALIIVVVGIVVTLWQHPSVLHASRFGPIWPSLTVPTRHQWIRGKPTSQRLGWRLSCSGVLITQRSGMGWLMLGRAGLCTHAPCRHASVTGSSAGSRT